MIDENVGIALSLPGLCILAQADPFVSVVIPVFNDGEALAGCLDSMIRQTYPANRFEVVVVDNGSTRDLSEIVAGRAGVSLIQCPQPGSYAARNRGVAASRGPILAFTDADCRPRPEWLAVGVAELQRQPDVAVLGGHVEVVSGHEVRMSAAELHQHLCGFPQQRYLEQQNFFATANVLTYKAVFHRVGPFDERLFSSGDLEWGQRAHARGCRLAYCGEAIVSHPARATMRALIRKSMRISDGHFQLRCFRGQSHLKAIRQIALKPLQRTFGDGPHAGLTIGEQARFLAVEWALAAVRMFETLRMLSGGAPRRR